MLKYAHENGCPWNLYTCRLAAREGHLEVLKYAHENGCPWDKWTCSNAARRGDLEMLKYAHENGCPWNVEQICASRSNRKVLEYVRREHTLSLS